MATLLRASRKGIIALYNKVVGGVEEEAASDIERAYGGFVRAEKGKLVEAIAKSVVQIAWAEAKGAADRLSFDEQRRYKVPIQQDYIKRLPRSVRRISETGGMRTPIMLKWTCMSLSMENS